MKNKAVFNYPIEVVYQAIAQLIVDNANAYNDNKYTLDTVHKIDYKFKIETTMGPFMNYSKVVDVKPNESISYTIHREKMEKYLVTYNLIKESDDKTRLDYRYELETDKKSDSLNHMLVSWLYKLKQNKKFKEMRDYLNTQCELIVSNK
ncbi:hypothetical protein AOC36_08815 [Erysipelothrix larvae]|uniref:DUF3284 domain-containing protein n=1 Tax=Erysipelothrix larvae TaxID=1514105 RepID=A0A0X8H150_9FIRM|nr:DUF3284 domain-containing protein [Erysipelothrix larvae]AMC94085.1 hypothetical protein AOC36_08815 [Erysipelothrix larvae]